MEEPVMWAQSPACLVAENDGLRKGSMSGIDAPGDSVVTKTGGLGWSLLAEITDPYNSVRGSCG
jgi:hypothetical protein